MSRRRADRGSIAIEYLGILPLVLAVALLSLQGITAVVVHTAAEDAARAAAQAAARNEDAGEAAHASLPGWLDGRVNRIDVDRNGSLVRVTVELDVPRVIGGLAGSATGEATFEER